MFDIRLPPVFVCAYLEVLLHNTVFMKLNRVECAGMLAGLTLAIFGGVFFWSVAHADVDAQAINNNVFNNLCQFGMIWAACEDEDMDPVVPMPDAPQAQEINCQIYGELLAAGAPIPSGFDASQCDDDEEGEGGGGNGGGGGGTTAACADGYDNDSDGLIDMGDAGCVDAADTDETDPASGGGGGGGGGSSGGGGGGGGYLTLATTTATSTGDVLGSASSTPAACDMYLTAFIKFGAQNDTEQVKRLQHVLKTFEGAAVEENGVYDKATLDAVHAFQSKYWEMVLLPWNIKQSTGFVYLTTRKKVNEIYCNNTATFPLSSEENAVIEKAKAAPAKVVSETPAAAPAPVQKKPAADAEKKAVTIPELPISRPWGTVSEFIRRLFNRDR